MLSEQFVLRLKASRAGYKVAKQVGVSGPWLSRLLFYDAAIREHDTKILKLGKLLGLKPEQVFVDEGRAAR